MWKGYLLLANLKYAALLWAMVTIGCPKAEAKKPNILFVISHGQSYPYSSIYGSQMVSTTAFDFVAKEGALFAKAYVTSSGCSPLSSTNNLVTDEDFSHDMKVLEFIKGSKEFSNLIVQNSQYKNLNKFGGLSKGRILLQDTESEVSFRSIKIRRLK